jgi:hypothetical protein
VREIGIFSGRTLGADCPQAFLVELVRHGIVLLLEKRPAGEELITTPRE